MARPPLQDLIDFGSEMQNSDVFDSEDLDFWRETMAAAEKTDPAILTLQRILPVRQHLLQQWDMRYNLSRLYPDMMRKFAQKDAEMYQMLQSKIADSKRN